MHKTQKQWNAPYYIDTDTLYGGPYMTAAPCLNKDLHTIGYENQTWIAFTKF